MSRILPLTALTALAFAGLAAGQAASPGPATSRFDPRLAELRRAAAAWQLRAGPTRRVIDQVCLVRDVATFYEALATWDDEHFFPILIDDVELDLKFLRAFRPSRVVRYQGVAKPIEPGVEWSRAVEAVGHAWTADAAPANDQLKGDTPPTRLGKVPPGAVIARPTSPGLPGLAALAAGRFQPLVRLDDRHVFKDMLPAEEIGPFRDALTTALAGHVDAYDRLGDDCDFLTLAGDYPFRYAGPKGAMALDDCVGRDAAGRRWAFAGRLMGDARQSVYAAMCSLFLRPERALLFDTYSETAEPWKFWGLRPAAVRLSPLLPTALLAGDRRATLRGWHEVFTPANRIGLVFVNTHGSPSVFNLPGGQGHALDVMPGPPAVVSMIHSYSAADPTDAGTIAGRWLAQGAFLYHGAMDEPYLNAFRMPGLVAELLAAGLPFAAAERPMADEPYGMPWKLVVLGDPLYTLARVDGQLPRTHDFPASAAWVPYAATPPPEPDSPEATRLGWSVNAALVRTTAGAADTGQGVLAVLLSIDRGRLAAPLRPVFDDLVSVLLYDGRRLDALRRFVAAIPVEDRPAATARLALAASLTEFEAALAHQGFDRAAVIWSDLVRSGPSADFVRQITGRLAPLADTPSRRDLWRSLLRAALAAPDAAGAREVIAAELKRVEEAGKGAR